MTRELQGALCQKLPLATLPATVPSALPPPPAPAQAYNYDSDDDYDSDDGREGAEEETNKGAKVEAVSFLLLDVAAEGWTERDVAR